MGLGVEDAGLAAVMLGQVCTGSNAGPQPALLFSYNHAPPYLAAGLLAALPVFPSLQLLLLLRLCPASGRACPCAMCGFCGSGVVLDWGWLIDGEWM